MLEYSNNQPREIAISRTSAQLASWDVYSRNQDGGGCSVAGYAISQTTFYIWARYDGVGSNAVLTNGWYMNA